MGEMAPQPLLYVSDANTVALIDIPTSIEHAQGTKEHSFEFSLRSREAQVAPFEGNEPRTEAARDKVKARTSTLPEDEIYQQLIDVALRKIHVNFRSDWCLPRTTTGPEQLEQDNIAVDKGVKRNRYGRNQGEHAEDNMCGSRPAGPLGDDKNNVEELQGLDSLSLASSTSRTDDEHNLHSPKSQIKRTFGINLGEPQWAIAPSESASSPLKVYLPPQSSFILCNFQDHKYIKERHADILERQNREPRDTDIIILDPPWPNRSARRNHNSNAYDIFRKPHDITDMLAELGLSKYLKRDGYLAVWITNNAQVREAVLGEYGLFDNLNLVLHEEWIWAKTTIKGEPITKLDGLWRKPYEVLLIGRHWQYGSSNIGRRVIAGVPDLHSRKPCLKAPTERWLGFEWGNYHALEIFARNLVAGWDSWGLEVLKFQDAENWIPRDADVDMG